MSDIVRQIASLVSEGLEAEAEDIALEHGLIYRTPHGGLRHNPSLESTHMERIQFQEGALAELVNGGADDISRNILRLLKRLRPSIRWEPSDSTGEVSAVWSAKFHEISNAEFSIPANAAMAFANKIPQNCQFATVGFNMHLSKRLFIWKLVTWS